MKKHLKRCARFALGASGIILFAIKADFWSLPLAAETRNYVPSLLALAVIISHPDQYPVYFPPVRNAPYLAQIDVGKQISLKSAAVMAGVSYHKIQQLNSGYFRLSSRSKGPSKLVIPIENVEQFTESLARSPFTHQINWQHHKVSAGDTLASIASKYKTSVSAIRKLNHLSKHKLRHGSTILIPTDEQEIERDIDAGAHEAPPTALASAHSVEHRKKHSTHPIASEMLTAFSSKKKYTLQPGDTIYMLRKKDTLESVSAHFHISQHDLLAVNQLKASAVIPGKQIIIPTHEKANKKRDILPGDTLYMVRHGDTIASIARRYKSSEASIRLANLIDDASLQEGERIVVPTHRQG